MNVYHKNLNIQKWAKYKFPQQILMIANEINRAKNCCLKNDFNGVKRAYERALELVWLTLECTGERNRRKELLRWKEVLLSEYITEKKSCERSISILKILLLLTPETAVQIRYLISTPCDNRDETF